MAHHIYHTPALVLDGRGIGEANKYFALFTRELGMIEASAQGVRRVESKLRSALRDFSRVNASLVRGKNGWKLTSAVPESNLFDVLKNDRRVLLVVCNVCALLKRLLRGEEKNPALFDLVAEGFDFLVAHRQSGQSAALSETNNGADISASALTPDPLTAEDIANAECVLVLNILHLLGYVGGKDELKNLISSPDFSPDAGRAQPVWSRQSLALVTPIRQKALAEINRSLKESQL